VCVCVCVFPPLGAALTADQNLTNNTLLYMITASVLIFLK